jgi:hypothetical protein
MQALRLKISKLFDGGWYAEMVEKQVVRISVDTNNIILGGLTKAYLSRLTDEINVGDTVIAHDLAEEADFNAVVVALMGNKAHLRLDWDSAQPWNSSV